MRDTLCFENTFVCINEIPVLRHEFLCMFKMLYNVQPEVTTDDNFRLSRHRLYKKYLHNP
jgi:hypothetical protein